MPKTTPSVHSSRDLPAAALPGLPSQPLSPEAQAEALRLAKSRAEQRVALGMRLFDAAEQRLTSQAKLMYELRRQQKSLQERVQEDVAKTLQAYDQWVGRIDEGFTHAIRELESKVDALTQEWQRVRQDVARMMERADALLDSARSSSPEAARDDAAEAEPASEEEQTYRQILRRARQDAGD